MMLLPMLAGAFQVNGINYDNLGSNEVAVGRGQYSGNIVIPSKVSISGSEYTVTSVSERAFYECTNVTAVTLPNTVKTIGAYAFQNCKNITSFTIPEKVTMIFEGAFLGCAGLRSIVIPETVERIGGMAFSACNGLTEVTIPENVIYLGNGVFSNCTGLTKAVIECSPTYDDSSSSLFPGCTQLKEAVFNCDNVYPYFRELTSLEKVTFKKKVNYVADNAFYNCSKLASLTVEMNECKVGDQAFYGCDLLKAVVYDCDTVPAIIQNVPSVESVYFTDKVKEIGPSAFGHCSGLKSIDIPKGVKIIGDNAFNGCDALESLGLPKTLKKIGQAAFANCGILKTIILPDSVAILGAYAFDGCTSLPKINLPDSLKTIEFSTFNQCKALRSVVIPNTIVTIVSNAFANCINLSSLTIGTGVKEIQSNAFSNTELKKVIWLSNTPPTGYTNVGGQINYVSNDQYTFATAVVYPLLSSVFEVGGIKYVPVSAKDKTCDAIDCIYDESSSITAIPTKVAYKDMEMTVKTIQPYVLYNNVYINHLTVGIGGVITGYALYGCENLQTAIFGKTDSGFDASKFTGLYIGSDVDSVGTYVFEECKALNKLIVADREKTLKLSSSGRIPLLSSCPLDSVYIGGDLTYDADVEHGYSPFYHNTSIRAVRITDKEKEITPNMFYACTNLKKVYIGNGVEYIGDWAFSGCKSLNYFAFGSGLKSIGTEAFSDCEAITEIISKAKDAPNCEPQALEDINKWECKLYVPAGSLESYKNTEQWEDFFYAEEGTGTAEESLGDEGVQKCEAPVINYADGKLTFSSDTEGAEFVYRITCVDTKFGNASEVTLDKVYKVTVYAVKSGFRDSDSVTKEIMVAADGGVYGDVNGDGRVNVADHVKLSEIIMAQ